MRLLVPVYDTNGIGNSLKSFISGLSICDDTKIVDNPRSALGNFHSVLEGCFMFDNSSPRILFDTWRFLVLKTEELDQPNLPNDQSHETGIHPLTQKALPIFSEVSKIDLYYDRSLIHDRVYNRIMRAIDKIQWRDTVLDEVALIHSRFVYPVCGVSVRTWKAPHEKNIRRPYDPRIYKDAIQKVVATEYPQTFFVSYDNEEAAKDYADCFQAPRLITYPRSPAINETQHAVIKMLLLSKCNIFICNRQSTYSELAFWFSRCTQKVIPLY